MPTINGLKFITSNILTIPGEPYQVKRTFKERFFSRPWRPLQAEKTIVPQIPDPKAVFMGNTVVMHPVVLRAFMTELKDEPSYFKTIFPYQGC